MDISADGLQKPAPPSMTILLANRLRRLCGDRLRAPASGHQDENGERTQQTSVHGNRVVVYASRALSPEESRLEPLG